ncbi:thiolase family protein [Acidocella aromatica]|uniref:Acetyl-CoA acetyltransferase n=1 Tax=Acidocella aromatica TaxID=1303579 RepID=A0A840VIJ2_9PROT|nr:hypothetical protein [Acidocella aromatica]MBB5373005.1 acetyl-CoA acetyltransferase [Acidocella aromatica]
MSPCIVGFSCGKLEKLENEYLKSLIVQAVADAIAKTALEPIDIDAIYIGAMTADLCRHEFPASLILQAYPDLHCKPATRVENDCATGSAAIYQGFSSIAEKSVRFALVVGAAKIKHLSSTTMGDVLIKTSYIPEGVKILFGFVCVFSNITDLYFEKYSIQFDTLVRIPAKNHRNGACNPSSCLSGDVLPFLFALRRSVFPLHA